MRCNNNICHMRCLLLAISCDRVSEFLFILSELKCIMAFFREATRQNFQRRTEKVWSLCDRDDVQWGEWWCINSGQASALVLKSSRQLLQPAGQEMETQESPSSTWKLMKEHVVGNLSSRTAPSGRYIPNYWAFTNHTYEHQFGPFHVPSMPTFSCFLANAYVNVQYSPWEIFNSLV